MSHGAASPTLLTFIADAGALQMKPFIIAISLTFFSASVWPAESYVEMVSVIDPLGRITAQLETRVFASKASGLSPVAILIHGSANGFPKRSIGWQFEGEYLSQRGYVVIAPMRRGRGRSTGASPESEEKNCDPESWLPGISTSMQDIDAAIEFSKNLPSVRTHDVLLVGVSRGGFLSVAYAAEGKYKTDVRQVINFVGGWVAQAEDQCPMDFNLKLFQNYGAMTHTKMLWLYGENDLFYGDVAVKAYARAFNSAGGAAEFHLLREVPGNGHSLLGYPDLWKTYVDQFLRSHQVP